MKNKITYESLRAAPMGRGHFRISAEFDGIEYHSTTTNTMAIDAAFDEFYDDEDNDGRYYDSREEAQDSLINEIINTNELND